MYIKQKNTDELRLHLKKYKKINVEEICNEECDVKPYIKEMKLQDARLRFKLRSSMVPTVKMNFQSDPKFSSDLWSCWSCSDPDSITHIKLCLTYSDLREDLDLDVDHDLVTYFRRVIDRREETDC